MIKIRQCKKCWKEFKTFNKRLFCTDECKCKYWDKKRADEKPRKSNKRYNLANEKRKIPLTQRQKEIAYWTLLGDGCLMKSSKTEESSLYKLLATHSSKQFDYIDWMQKEFASVMSNGLMKYIRKDRLRPNWDPYIQYHLQTIWHGDFAQIKWLLYRGKNKFVTRRFLNLLTPLSLAVWYMDDGTKQWKWSVLCTYWFSISENRTIKQYFHQKWWIETNIRKIENKKKNTIYYWIFFPEKETVKLFKLISPYIIPSMKYKILSSTTNTSKTENDNSVKIESIPTGDSRV